MEMKVCVYSQSEKLELNFKFVVFIHTGCYIPNATVHCSFTALKFTVTYFFSG